MSARNPLLFVVLVCWTMLNACELDSAAPHDAAQITGFDLLTANNPELSDDVIGVIGDTTITLHVPADTDLTSLVPTIQHNGDHLTPDTDQPQDFSDPVDYSVIAANGDSHTYHVTVVSAASSRKDIKGFRIDSVPGVVNGTNITLTLPYGTDVSMLRGFVSYNGASVSPESGSVQDFSSAVDYTVTAQDGSTQKYTVIVAIAPSNAKDITELSIDDVIANISGTQISITLPNGTDVHALEPSVVHTGASISPESGSAQDFSEPVMYTVTAADGSTKRYSVTVTVATSDAKEITKFTWGGRSATIAGDKISLTVPFGTDVTSVAPNIVHTGKSISPASGIARDFSQPIPYTVTAADGSTHVYTVTVTVAPNTAHEITDLIILGVHAVINGSNIAITLPFGTDPTSVVPTVSHTGASIAPESGTTRNFSVPGIYTVTAADGSTKVYTVTLTVAKSNAHEISAFSVLNVAGTFTDAAIAVTVPFGSDLHSVVPTLTHTGASIQPAADMAQDFRNPVMYTVTAADGSTKVFTVTVTVAKNSAHELTAFSVLGVAGTFTGSAIAVTVPYGSDVHSVVPVLTYNGASIAPAADAAQDFRSPVVYTVTASNGQTGMYTVTVTVAPNSAKDITAFSVGDVPGTFGPNSITLTLPHGTNLTTVQPTIAISGASVSPASGVVQTFSNPVTYTVTAEDHSTKQYLVTVSEAKVDAKAITSFSIGNVAGKITPTGISITVPSGADVTKLKPTVVIAGKSVDPLSGAEKDFTSPVTYTVTADDNTTKAVPVTVTVGSTSTKDITGFSVLGMPAAISGNAISITLPFGTDLTRLSPVVQHDGASVSPASGTQLNFTSGQSYTVTAADNSTQSYTVTISTAASGSKNIIGFDIMGITPTIMDTAVALSVPSATVVTSLTPIISLSGSSVSPASGQPVDFTNPVTYTVKDSTGATKTYTVTVSISP